MAKKVTNIHLIKHDFSFYSACIEDKVAFVNFARDNFKLLVINKYIKVLLNFVKSFILHPLTFFHL